MMSKSYMETLMKDESPPDGSIRQPIAGSHPDD